jgi:hypothetical protein
MLNFQIPYKTGMIMSEAQLFRHNILEAWSLVQPSASVPVAIVCSTYPMTAVAGDLPTTVTGYDYNTGATFNALKTKTASTGGSYSTTMATLNAVATGGATSRGYIGAAPGAPLIQVILNGNSDADWSAGIQKAFDLGAKVILCPESAGVATTPGSAMWNTCAAVYAAGAVIVSANAQSSSPRGPADCPNAIVPAAVKHDDNSFAQNMVTTNTNAFGPYGSFFQCTSPAGLYYNDLQYYVNIVLNGLYSIVDHNSTYPPGSAAGTIAGIAQLIWSANPSLTPAQVRTILLAECDPARTGWRYTTYYPNSAGFPDAARGVLRARSLLAGNSGVAMAYLRVHGRKYQTADDDMTWLPVEEGLQREVSGGLYRVRATGQVGLELGGYAAAGPITNVQLWVNGAKLYDNVPTSPALGNLFQYIANNAYTDIHVVASTATGQTGTQSYVTDSNSTTGAITQLTGSVLSSSGSITTIGGSRASGAVITVS